MSKLKNWQKNIIGEMSDEDYDHYIVSKFSKKKNKQKKKKFKLKEE